MASTQPSPPRQRNCGTMIVHERLLRTNAEYAAARARSETRAWEFANRMRQPPTRPDGV